MNGFIKFLLILVILSTLGNLVGQVILWAPPVVDSETAGGSGSDNSGNQPGNDNENKPEEEVQKPVADVQISASVTPDENGQVPAGGVSINGVTASANVPEGVQLENGTTELTLTVNGMDESGADLDLNENEVSTSLDVHMAGVSTDNAIPMEIKLLAAAVKGLNSTSIKLYHVENGETVEMTRVANDEEFTAHNQFKYNPATGDVTLYVAGFSEFAVVEDTVNAWNGGFDYSWYDANKTELTIANAQQLAAFGAIVGYMTKVEGESYVHTDIAYESTYYGDSFEGKTVKLIADINLGDKNNANESLIFYPIGYYYTDDKDGNGATGDYYSTVSDFSGIFDGNGHTIKNFYQNTWEIKGDYDGNYYKDAMGLFGYVVNGTIKNLTVDNFSSDGEFTPTGVIAAYAVNSTFENIAITNCNPRVYNTGNGGIVGIGGNSDDPDTYKLTFTNITIDNSNIISALWGSWDVACGGLMGMFRGAGHVYMTNCHVGAQIDVYNDVCGNYQYYWYRYSGMMIGTNKNMITDEDGYTVPETSKFHAENCTVHFGDWNDYYYCELVANSLASYTHDHQFSRLTQIQSVSEIQDANGNWTTTGNFILMNGKTPTDTCYHIVKDADGNLTEHKHEDAGEETVNGETVLKENNQRIYLPFNQLFTGYGWGVKHIPVYNGEDYAFDGITILDRETAESVEKFEGSVTELSNNKVYTFADIFGLVENGVPVKADSLTIAITNLDTSNPVSADILYDRNNWKGSTITFTGTGEIKITIQDYYFCTPTTITVNITERQSEEKFDIIFNNGDFLHRVGNIGTVELGKLFEAKNNVTIGNVSVTVESVDSTSASGTYTESTNWKNGTIQFSGTGVVKVTITDNDYCKPTELYLEVVDAINATSATNATSNNVVLLNDIGSGFTVSGEYTFFGNGFTLNYTGDGRYLNNGLKQGIVTVSENGTLDNLHIKASIYPTAFMYYGTTSMGDYVQQSSNPREVEGDKTRYYYQLSSVVAKGNATIQNCYIYGGRTNIFVDTGNVTIKDSILECGTVSNVQIQSTAEYTVTIENVTTIQYQVNATIGDTSKVMLGLGVLVGPDTTSNPTIVLNGDFKQYNWVTQEDYNALSSEVAKMIIKGALDATAYNHTINGKTASNLGIIYMNEAAVNVKNNTGLPYKSGTVSLSGQNGQVCSLQNASANQIYSDYENANKTTVNGDYLPTFDFNLGDQMDANDGNGDNRYLYGDKNGLDALYQDGNDPITINIDSIASIYKYTGIPYTVTAKCIDANGNELTKNNGIITLNAKGTYTLVFTVTDDIFYDKDGKPVYKSVERTYTIPVTLDVKAADIKNAVVNITKTALDGVYNTVNLNDYELRIKFLDCISITDYDNKGNGTTVNLSSNISSATLTPSGANVFTTAFTITITYTDGRVLTVNFSRISGSSPGTKTGKVNTSGSVYFTTEGALNNKPTESSSQNECTITSVSFKGNSGSTVTNDTDVTVTWALGSSSSEGSCLAEGTLITLADGTKKAVEELRKGDMVMSFDHLTGKLTAENVIIVVRTYTDHYYKNTFVFDDGTELVTINEHGIFDLDLNKYVNIDHLNYEQFIGHNFVAIDTNGNITTKKLVDVITVEGSGYKYDIVTDGTLNYVAEDTLSVTHVLVDVINSFDFGANLMYDAEKMQADIEKYGLYDYSEWEEYCDISVFEEYNIPVMKVGISKGLYTKEYIISLINTYVLDESVQITD